MIHIYKYPGFSIWGISFGGILGSFIYFKKNLKNQAAFLFDVFAVSLSIFVSFVFVGYFFDGVYVGFNTQYFGLKFIGFPGLRFPIQLPASLLFFGYFLLFRNFNFKKYKGFLFWMFLCYFFGILLTLEFFRGDRIYFEGIAINKLAYFLISLFSGTIFILKYKNLIIEKLRLIKNVLNFKKKLVYNKQKQNNLI